jgi:hypothetical protein
VPANSLVRAFLGAGDVDGFGVLGMLVVRDVWSPVTPAPAAGSYFRVRDTHVRCIRAPCFSFRAWRVNRAYSVTISDLDLAVAGGDPGALRRAEDALVSSEGLLAAGRVSRTAAGGRILEASQLFLRAPLPRA